MPGTKRVDLPLHISHGDQSYPDRLVVRLGADAPKRIAVIGSITAFSAPMTALLCSKETPGATILKAFDQAAAWRDAGRCVISGFHSPLERQCLDILLRGKQPIVLALARGIGTLRLSALLRRALDEGRLTIVSQFPETMTRVTAAQAHQRNRFVAAMSNEITFAFIAYASTLSSIEHESKCWGILPHRLHG